MTEHTKGQLNEARAFLAGYRLGAFVVRENVNNADTLVNAWIGFSTRGVATEEFGAADPRITSLLSALHEAMKEKGGGE